MKFKPLNRKSVIIAVTLITFLAFFLRIYRLGFNDLKEEENTAVKAAAYQYYCLQDKKNCQQSTKSQNNVFSKKLTALLSNNETIPNLFISNYLWDWVKDKPTQTHYSRAWPHLFSLSAVYKFFSISHFSSRIISVITGTLLIPVSFIFARYFLGSVSISLLYSSLIVFGFNFIDISRYTRMYSTFIFVFLLAVYFIFKTIEEKKNKLLNLILATIFFSLAYFLHLLTLLLPTAIYVYSFYFGFIKKEKKYKKIFYFLSTILLFLFYLKLGLNIDFFQIQFSSWLNTPHWQYLKLLFNHPLPAIISLGLIIANLPRLFDNKKTAYLVIIVFTSLIYLIFFSKPPPGSAYVINLLPIALWLLLLSINHFLKTNKKITQIVFTVLVFIAISRWILGVNYLYFGKNGQAKPSQAYQVIFDNFQSDDQIIGIQIRDYYLKNLPNQTQVIDLPGKQSFTKKELIQLLDQSKSTFFLWEKEKIVHLKPEVANYIKKNFQKLAGEGIDNYQIEIYYLPK